MQSKTLLARIDDWLFPRLAPCARVRARVHAIVLAMVLALLFFQIVSIYMGRVSLTDGLGLTSGEWWVAHALRLYFIHSIWILPPFVMPTTFRRLRNRELPCGVCGYPLNTVQSIACPGSVASLRSVIACAGIILSVEGGGCSDQSLESVDMAHHGYGN